MKVALDVSAVPERIAGAGRYIAELAKRLPEHGVTTTLVTRRHDESRWRGRSPKSTIAPIVPDARAARLLYEAVRLGTSTAARGVDVWHGPHYTMPRRAAVPAVVTIHDLTFFTNPEWHERSKVAFFRRSIAYSAAYASVLVCVSDFTARQLDEVMKVHAPVVVAPHGVDLERFVPDGSNDEALLGAHGLVGDAEFILFVGTLEPRKGIDVLLGAFADVARANPRIELWLAGQLGWGLGDVDAMLASHPAASRIRRLGFVDEDVLPALMRRARAVAYPSKGEGFGLPVLEAMACGALVVTTSGTVMAEVAGADALLVPVGDTAALAGALESAVASSDDVRRTRSRLARVRAEQYTWERSMQQHLIAYEMARRRA